MPPTNRTPPADQARQELTSAGLTNEADLNTGESSALALAGTGDGTPQAKRGRVPAYDKETGKKLPHKVPVSHLDGRFPNLVETPSSKAGN
ncbi:hypothetical protein ASF72_10635 [Arthrobacter sp. Leaf141]|uniref:hypothetical protein n=1 Tax=Arthrobacter sp. Leaf141 TaxID=1736273 RepID=UPI0006F2F157|nr:hypothetical protein [Arthrobacter sp. Leaf141]KQR02482.1 hypothetical protein ASF72_10635 [Arthrobacter sp. Leaf141]